MASIAIDPGVEAPGIAVPGGEDLPRGRARSRWFSGLLILCAAGAILQPLGALAARADWRLDLATHFAEPACWLAAFCMAASLWRRSFRVAAAWGALVLYQAIPLARYSAAANPIPPDPGSSERLKLVVANVLWDNPHHDRLMQLLRDEKPDVVGLLEFSPLWLSVVDEIRKDYPHCLIAPKYDSGFGFALFSKYPLLSSRGPEYPTPLGWPYLSARIDFGGRPLDLFVIHPSNPLRRPEPGAGHPEMEEITRQVAAAGPTRVVVGDFNTTEGSPYFRDMAAITGLRDSRLGFGRQTSWPTFLPFRIPIDHALVSRDLAVVGRRLGPNIGSDHFPVILELAPAANDSASALASARPASAEASADGSN